MAIVLPHSIHIKLVSEFDDIILGVVQDSSDPPCPGRAGFTPSARAKIRALNSPEVLPHKLVAFWGLVLVLRGISHILYLLCQIEEKKICFPTAAKLKFHTQRYGSGSRSQQWKSEYAQLKYVEMVTITDFVYHWRMSTWIQINRRYAETLIEGKLWIWISCNKLRSVHWRFLF